MASPSPGRPTFELTAWHAADARPAHRGVYERRDAPAPYACWGGDGWFADADTPEAAAGQEAPSACQRAAWRGLAHAPDTPCRTCRGHTVLDRGVDEDSGGDLIGECPDC